MRTCKHSFSAVNPSVEVSIDTKATDTVHFMAKLLHFLQAILDRYEMPSLV
jgi:hypothetical protein